MGVFALGGALGALLAYFFDPQSGNRRRRLAFDRTAAFFRSGSRQTARAGRGLAAEAYGVSQKVQHLKETPKDFDDEVFRDPDIPKGKVNVNVQNGVVQLRGEVPRTELIEDLVEQTRRVQGVRDVENLLHLPGTDAPMHG